MTNFDPTTWIQKKRIENRLNPKPTTTPLSTFLKESTSSKTPSATEPQAQNFSHHSLETTPWWIHEIEQFTQSVVSELLHQSHELLKLNKSRREGIARFLAEICQQPEPTNPEETLKCFVRSDRSACQQEALTQLFKQIAFVQIGKALLLKSWNKNQGHPLVRADLKDLTGAVEKALRPFIHLQTSACQLIQKNFYSWYKVSSEAQEMLWGILSKIEVEETTLDWLLHKAIHLSAETLGERQRYQEGLYQNLWKNLQRSSVLDSRFQLHLNQSTPTFAFCPTLRDGSVMKFAPSSLQWIGFEPLTFELIFCEIRALWNKPQTPSLWVKGSSLEMQMDPQSSWLVSHDGKQNVLQQIDGISSCELAFVAEETPIRTQSRTRAAQALRKQVDQHSVLKKIKHPSTTRGMYQACQSLGKLRQNGVLIWVREELLSEASGKPALQYILNEAKLLMICDFTALQCNDEQLKLDLPKAFYLFKKENQLEARKNHRPLLVKAYGTIQQPSHISLLFERVFSYLQKPDLAFPAEPFSLHARVSPVIQSEWEQHWLNPSDDQLVERIEDLKRNASPLGQLAMVRTIQNPFSHLSAGHKDLFENLKAQKTSGFFAWVENTKNGCELITAGQDRPPTYIKPGTTLFWISPHQENWSASLQMLLRSQMVQDWINYSVERKKGVWVLKDHDLKSVPVPNHIYTYLKTNPELIDFTPEEEVILNQISIEPSVAHQKLERETPHLLKLKGAAFQRAAEVLLDQEINHSTLFSMVISEDEVNWTHLIDSFLPENERLALDHHPLVRYNATLPAHLPIHHMTLTKHASPGILLANNSGLTQMLYIQNEWLRTLTYERIKLLTLQIAEPTFAELCHHLRLPKNPDQCQAMGQQFLRSFTQEKMRRKELVHLMGTCLISQNIKQAQIGLLQ